jgi:hypothetical protein
MSPPTNKHKQGNQDMSPPTNKHKQGNQDMILLQTNTNKAIKTWSSYKQTQTRNKTWSSYKQTQTRQSRHDPPTNKHKQGYQDMILLQTNTNKANKTWSSLQTNTNKAIKTWSSYKQTQTRQSQYSWNITDVPHWCLAVNNRWINHFVIARWKYTETKRNEMKRYNTKWNKTYFNETISWGKTRQKLNEKNRESII